MYQDFINNVILKYTAAVIYSFILLFNNEKKHI